MSLIRWLKSFPYNGYDSFGFHKAQVRKEEQGRPPLVTELIKFSERTKKKQKKQKNFISNKNSFLLVGWFSIVFNIRLLKYLKLFTCTETLVMGLVLCVVSIVEVSKDTRGRFNYVKGFPLVIRLKTFKNYLP